MPVFMLIPAAVVGYKLWQKRQGEKEESAIQECDNAETSDGSNDEQYEILADADSLPPRKLNSTDSTQFHAEKRPLAQASSVSDDTSPTCCLESSAEIDIPAESIAKNIDSSVTNTSAGIDGQSFKAGPPGTTHVTEFNRSSSPSEQLPQTLESKEKTYLGPNEIRLSCSIDEQISVPPTVELELEKSEVSSAAMANKSESTSMMKIQNGIQSRPNKFQKLRNNPLKRFGWSQTRKESLRDIPMPKISFK